MESYPEDVEGRSVSTSFLHNGTVSLIERHGFERTRRIGKHCQLRHPIEIVAGGRLEAELPSRRGPEQRCFGG